MSKAIDKYFQVLIPGGERKTRKIPMSYHIGLVDRMEDHMCVYRDWY